MINKIKLSRFFAFIVDVAILLSMCGVLVLLSFFGAIKNDEFLRLMAVVLCFLYFYLFGLFSKGATIGKKIFKIRIVSIKGNDDAALNIFIRESIFMLMPLLVDFSFSVIDWLFWGVSTSHALYSYFSYLQFATILALPASIYFSKKSMGIHDVLSKTIVIWDDDKALINIRKDKSLYDYAAIFRVSVLKCIRYIVIFVFLIALIFRPFERYFEKQKNYLTYIYGLTTDLSALSYSLNNIGYYVDNKKPIRIELVNDLYQLGEVTFDKSPYVVHDDLHRLSKGPYIKYTIPVTGRGFFSRDFLSIFPKAILSVTGGYDYNVLLCFKFSRDCGFFGVNISRYILIVKTGNYYSIIEPDVHKEIGMNIHTYQESF